jgi:hypothetical protein
MRLGDRGAHVEIAVLEVLDGPGRAGDVHLRTQIEIPGSSRDPGTGFAVTLNAWIDRDEWLTFLSELKALERDRKGEALLVSLGAREVKLRLLALDSLGHMGVAGDLTGYHYRSSRPGPQTVQFTFGPISFDPTQLPHLIHELEAGTQQLG